MLRKQRVVRSRTDLNRGRLDNSEIGTRRDPPGRILTKVLTFGFNRAVVNRSYDVRLVIAHTPKTSGNAKSQRANGNHNHNGPPLSLGNPAVSQRLHVPISHGSYLARLYNIGTRKQTLPRCSLPAFFDTESMILVARTPQRAAALTPKSNRHKGIEPQTKSTASRLPPSDLRA